jgi:hypothetical protein
MKAEIMASKEEMKGCVATRDGGSSRKIGDHRSGVQLRKVGGHSGATGSSQ